MGVTTAETARPGLRTALSPLARPTYRMLWIAQLASNVGTWMDAVAAQWLMADLSDSPLAVALIQTATTLPVLLVAVPAGALGDVLDRRRLLIASQVWMLLAAVTLTVTTAAGAVTPASLLALVFALGLGAAVTLPAWQAIQPELVARDEIPRASALGAVSMNLARSVGPAVGGVIVALAGPQAVFALDAVSFLAVIGALIVWRRAATPQALGAEPFGDALRTGVRYVRSSVRLRWLLARTGLFVLFSSALIALLPLEARTDLGLGAGGYGLLLGAFGVGAVGGALAIPLLRTRWALNPLVGGATGLLGLCVAVVGVSDVVALTAVALLIGGACWTAVLSTMNATAQSLLPSWVRARGMAVYILSAQGGMAIGAAVWGLVATLTDVRIALLASAAGLAATILTARRLPVRHGELDLSPVEMHLPDLAIEPDPADGPVLITVGYRVPPANADAFVRLATRMGRFRRRTGARRWSLWQDQAEPGRYVETFVVGTWGEHLRQHLERNTVAERELAAEIRALLEPGTDLEIAHQLAIVRGPGPARPSASVPAPTGGPLTPS